MSINGALKKLVTKLGGTSTKKTTEGLINEITANIDGGGSGGGGGGEGGGGGGLVVNLVKDLSSNLKFDKTVSEVLSAMSQGTSVVFINNDEANSKVEYCTLDYATYKNGYYTFVLGQYNDNYMAPNADSYPTQQSYDD